MFIGQPPRLITQKKTMRYNALRLFASILVFFFTWYIGSFFVYGDQEHYRFLYESMYGENIFSSFILYRNRIQSQELIHFIVIWSFSDFIDKDILMSFVNGLLAWTFIGVFNRFGANIYLSIILVTTNTYFFALYFSAERLKFGFLFLGLGFLLYGRKRYSYLFLYMAALSHIQTILFILAAWISNVFQSLLMGKINLKISKYKFFLFPFIVFLVVVFIYLLHEQIILKFHNYYKGFDFTEVIKMLIITGVALFYAPSKHRAFILFIFIILSVFTVVVGGDRINIYGFFVLFCIMFTKNKGVNVLYLLIFSYFTFKSIRYVYNILEYGVNVVPN